MITKLKRVSGSTILDQCFSAWRETFTRMMPADKEMIADREMSADMEMTVDQEMTEIEA